MNPSNSIIIYRNLIQQCVLSRIRFGWPIWSPGSTHSDWRKVQGLLIQPLLHISGLPGSTSHSDLLSAYGLCELHAYYKVDLANFLSSLFSPIPTPSTPNAIDPYLRSFYKLFMPRYISAPCFRASVASLLANCVASNWQHLCPSVSVTGLINAVADPLASAPLDSLLMLRTSRRVRPAKTGTQLLADLHADLKPHLPTLSSYCNSAKIAVKKAIDCHQPCPLIRRGSVHQAGTLLRFLLKSFYLFPGLPQSCRLANNCPLCQSTSLSSLQPIGHPVSSIPTIAQLDLVAQQADFRLSYHLLLHCPHPVIAPARLIFFSSLPPLDRAPTQPDGAAARDTCILLILGLHHPMKVPARITLDHWQAATDFLHCVCNELRGPES